MIISTWNIRGFNKAIKHSEVVSFLRTNKVDIIGILETRVKQNKAKKIIKAIFCRYNSFCNYNKHQNGRIWLLWNPSTTKVDIIEEHSQVVHCSVRHLATGRSFYFSIVYGSNNAGKRTELWDSLTKFPAKVDNWTVMGDFNVVRHPDEKISNNPPVLSELVEFNTCLSTCGLDDLPGSGCDFTWFNKQEATTRVYSKLDRVLVNESWLDKFSQTTASFLASGISDHSPAMLYFHDADLPKKRFKFLNCWTEHKNFKKIVTDHWNLNVRGNSMFRLMAKLKNIKGYLKLLHKDNFSNISDRVNAKRLELTSCFQNLRSSPHSSELINQELALSKEFWHLKETEL
ncbi:uncharacterized protein LOC141637214 [Silene latifolia]|uniref:uncharacterized protein LOC141637214 n=1 Tax=Silene latifolia TaxID=37657 RepID=UPI003D78A04B